MPGCGRNFEHNKYDTAYAAGLPVPGTKSTERTDRYSSAIFRKSSVMLSLSCIHKKYWSHGYWFQIATDIVFIF
jgi:hypothetical protein